MSDECKYSKRLPLAPKKNASNNNLIDKKLKPEANWILKQMNKKATMGDDDLSDQICNILEAYKSDQCEVPFIYTYKQHIYKQLFERDEIWTICDLDKEWEVFQQKKTLLKSVISPISAAFEDIEFVNEDLEKVENYQDLQDIQLLADFYSLLLPNGVPSKDTKLTNTAEAKIPEFCTKIMMRPCELRNNIAGLQALKAPPVVQVHPLTQAKEYVTDKFPDFNNENNVLAALTTFAAKEISALPIVRKIVRNSFMENAVVSTVPTLKGEGEFDLFMPSYRVKQIVKRPISSFEDDLWIEIKKYETKQFIAVRMELEEAKLEELLQNVSEYYVQIGSDQEAVQKECNRLRKEAVKKAIKEILLPEAETRARDILFKNAEQYVIKKSCELFTKQLSGTPIGWKYVISFVVEPRNGNTLAVQMAVVDQFNEIVDNKLFEKCSLNASDTINQGEIIMTEEEDCKKLLQKFNPALIVIGANGLEALIFKKLLQKWTEAPLIWGDINIPKIYSKLDISAKQIQGSSPLQKLAISLARLQQDSLSETLNIWPEEEANLPYKLHQQQDMVNLKKLYNALKHTAIECVCDAGIDINKIIQHQHLNHLLGFVCGLDSTKIQQIISKGCISKRSDLLEKALIDKNTYKNSIGFIKVNNNEQCLLDQTRIHPNMYNIAQKIAQEAAILENKDAVNLTASQCIEKILRNPNMLRNVQLDKLIQKLEFTNEREAKITTEFIIQELSNPFQQFRKKAGEPIGDELIRLLLGDTTLKYQDGMIISATILRIEENKLICKLDNKIEGIIEKSNIINDETEANMDLSKKFTVNSVIPVRIKGIKIDDKQILATLTAKKQDLQYHLLWIPVELKESKWFYINPTDLVNKTVGSDNFKLDSATIRQITHERFMNITESEANEYLSGKGVGEFVFHPSTKGEGHITATLKMYKNAYAHLDIAEDIKRREAFIGNIFTIENEIYDSLDDIITRYINPVGAYAREASSFRKFFEAKTQSNVDDYLIQEQQKQPSLISYCFSILPENSDSLLLGYRPNKEKLFKEYIKIKPQGFYFHDFYHKNMGALVSWFKQHCMEAEYQKYMNKTNSSKDAPLIPEQNKNPETNNEWGTGQEEKKNAIPNQDSWGQPSTQDKKPQATSNNDWGIEPSKNQQDRGSGFRGRGPRRGIVCYNCQQEGHTSRDCPTKDESSRGFRGRDRGRSRGRGGRFNSGRGRGGFERNNDDKPAGETVSWGNPGQNDSWDAPPASAPTNNSWGSNSNAKEENKGTTSDSWGANTTNPPPANDSWGGNATNQAKPSNDSWGESANNQPKPANESVGGNTKPVSDSWGGNTSTQVKSTSDNGNATAQPTAPSEQTNGKSNPQPKPAADSWGDTSSAQPKPSNDSWGDTAKAPEKPTTDNSWGAPKADNNSSNDWGKSDGGYSGFNTVENKTESNNWGDSAPSWGVDTSGDRPMEGSRGRGRGGRSDRGGRGRGRGCFNCGQEGHMAKDCPTKSNDSRGRGRGRGCYNCGQEGHMASDCPTKSSDSRGRGRGRGGGDRNCYRCGKPGHISRDCPEPNTGRGRGSDRRRGFRDSQSRREDAPSWGDNKGFGGAENGERKRSRSKEGASQPQWGNDTANTGWGSSDNNQAAATKTDGW